GEANLIDTVGFISDLPTHLVDSFRATLEEALDADLLIHVRDRSSDADEEQKQDVLKVLQQLSDLAGMELPPILEVWNKIDRVGPSVRDGLDAERERLLDQIIAVPVSAVTGEGIETLLAVIEGVIDHGRARLCARLTSKDGALRAWLHANTQVEQESFDEAGNAELHISVSR
ncbi:MAG: GTPase HflX, partial [Pseudomonadota bacterium]